MYSMDCRDIGTHPGQLKPDYKIQVLKRQDSLIFLLVWENTMTKIDLRRKIFISNSNYDIVLYLWVKSGQKLKVETKAEEMQECWLLACSTGRLHSDYIETPGQHMRRNSTQNLIVSATAIKNCTMILPIDKSYRIIYSIKFLSSLIMLSI